MCAADPGRPANGRSRAGGADADARASQRPRIRVAKAERHQQAAKEYFADVMHKRAPQSRSALKTVWREPSGIISRGKQRVRLPTAGKMLHVASIRIAESVPMNRLAQSEYDLLSRKLARLIGQDQLSALAPSQRGLLTLLLNELLEERGALSAISPDDMLTMFERVAGFLPVIGDRERIVEDF